MLTFLRKTVLIMTGLCLSAICNLFGQALFSTLTGVVTDPSGAVVACAKVTLVDADSGSSRDTVTDNQGYYTFASVAVGRYTVTIQATGFQNVKVTDINLGGGEKRNVNASLVLGSTNQTVEVTGSADIVTPEDSGEKADVLGTHNLRTMCKLGAMRQNI